MDLKSLIRNVQDFPKPGIGFKDITTLLLNGPAFIESVDRICSHFFAKSGSALGGKDTQIDAVMGIESRGFIFAGAIAYKKCIPFIPARKPGKLPAAKIREEYSLEYGTDAIEVHADAIRPGSRILIMDDLLATGGTVRAACNLVEKAGGKVAGIGFLIELDFLHGIEKLKGYDVISLVHFDSE